MDCVSRVVETVFLALKSLPDILQILLLIINTIFVSLILALAYYFMSARRGRLQPQRVCEEYQAQVEQTTSLWYTTNKNNNLIFLGAITGVTLVAVVQLSAVPNLDAALTISIHAFALTMALLAGEILLQRQMSLYEHAALTNITTLARVGLLIGVVGVTALFYHFSVVTGILFGVASGMAYGSLMKWLAIQRALKSDDTNGNERDRE